MNFEKMTNDQLVEYIQSNVETLNAIEISKRTFASAQYNEMEHVSITPEEYSQRLDEQLKFYEPRIKDIDNEIVEIKKILQGRVNQ